MANDQGWQVVLEGVAFSGGPTTATIEGGSGYGELPYGEGPYGGSYLIDEIAVGCLTEPPDGIAGLPDLRTEDVTYPQRDGVRHFADWYGPRIVTMTNVQVCGGDCSGCPGAREKVAAITKAWSRKCEDVELVVFTPCHGEGDKELAGPYGIVGRPRVLTVQWRTGRRLGRCAVVTARFDANDHRMFLLDDSGEPGSGIECVTLTPDVVESCRSYPRCYPVCYDINNGGGGGPQTFNVSGTECAYPTITLTGQLTEPIIENLDTGAKIGYAETIPAGAPPVIIDTQNGTATQGGASRTHLLTGSPRLLLSPGENTLRLTSFSSSDNGTAEVCWRPAVVTG